MLRALHDPDKVQLLLRHGARIDEGAMVLAAMDPSLAAYSLAGFEAEDQPSDALTDALVHYLLLHQHQDGRWPPEAYRPPEDGSAFLFTALAVRGIQAYAPRGRRAEIAASSDKTAVGPNCRTCPATLTLPDRC